MTKLEVESQGLLTYVARAYIRIIHSERAAAKSTFQLMSLSVPQIVFQLFMSVRGREML